MTSFGSNIGFVDDLYARFLEDPASVSESWREFFADYTPSADVVIARAGGAGASVPEATGSPRPATGTPDSTTPAAPAVPAVPAGAEPLRGIAGKTAENMIESLAVPTATSFRILAVKLLEENRRVLNQHQLSTSSARISFTHLIAWGVVRALEKNLSLNGAYVEIDGQAYRAPRPKINLGLAIDLEKRGERVLLVPNLKDAGALDFVSFVAAYNDLVDRARNSRLKIEDFQDTTVTLTNPGMIGTNMSVPRLMTGQGSIIGVGSIGYPPEYSGVAPEVISELGLSKVMTVTSTYDHRVVQGAESGAFLSTLDDLFTGRHGFYERIFAELNVPHEPLEWSGDHAPRAFNGEGNFDAIRKQAQVLQLIRAYRVRGHLWAHLDPLGTPPVSHEELELSHYGLSVWDLDREFISGDLAGEGGVKPLREILDILRDTYCRHIGVEFMQITDPEVRRWLLGQMESTRNHMPIPPETQMRILSKLNSAEALERFLHTTYLGHKRFSLEGAETLIPMLDALLNDAGADGVERVIIGMAHRGRLNVLSNTVGKSYRQIFSEFEGHMDPRSAHGSGDVKYHLGARGSHEVDGRLVAVEVASNPSHLEAVDPVVEGMVRAVQDLGRDTERGRAVPVLIHGDGAFAGQGVVAETLHLSKLPGYRTGGTVHIVVNNQIGFTTAPHEARSSYYATDAARMVAAPVFHVNGDHPEDAVRTIKIAFAYRQRFRRDVVVDLICYRRWGHNETDDPSYSNPTLYQKIEKHRSVRKIYTERLLRRGDIDVETAEKTLDHFRAQLAEVHEEVRKLQDEEAPPRGDTERTEGEVREADDARTGAPTHAVLVEVLEGLDRVPEGFTIHPKLARQLARRYERFETGQIDWALAEALAFGSLVKEGIAIRLSGEDSRRGTFSQRHAALNDVTTGEVHVPLDHLEEGQAAFTVFDSHLSEFAVLGFEYGYSVKAPDGLTLWEAQFGDFANGAQVIIDQFLCSAEDKWAQRSGLVLLLPHGYEGQGPEHSSARMERFLQLCARGNMNVCAPSTPAQYFHLLRRQARMGTRRKPLVVMTPKSLLRASEAVSTGEELTGGAFQEVIDDARIVAPDEVRRVLLCTGKIFYDLDAHRVAEEITNVAVVRMEQLYRFPGEELTRILARYARAEDVVWVQEEPRNMGAWDFLDERIIARLEGKRTLRYCGRPASPSPATGSQKRHLAEQVHLVQEAFAPRES